MPWTAACALLIGLVGFFALDRDCALRRWHAPASPEEMKELLREALPLGGAPIDLLQLEHLDRFAADASQLPHWHSRGPSSEPEARSYRPKELVAFLLDSVLFYNDEWHKPAETYYYHLFWEQRDLTSPDWSGNLLARTNPTLAKFLLGAGIDLQTAGPHPIQTLGMQEMFYRWWSFGSFLLAAMDRDVLIAARRTSAAFGAGSLLLIFLLGRRLGGRVGFASGLLAAGLLFATPLFRYYASRATVDVMLLFSMLLGGLATSYFVPCSLSAHPAEARRRWRLVSATIALGFASGLAAGIKLNGALVGVGAAVGCALGLVSSSVAGSARGAPVRSGSARLRQVALSLLGAASLTLAIFVASNPYYHRDPLSRMQRTLQEMRRELANNGPAITSRSEALRATFYYTTMTAGRHGRALLTRSAAPPFEPMELVVVEAPVQFWFRAALAAGGLLLGLAFLAAGALSRKTEGGLAGVRFGVMAWALALILGFLLWLPLRWDRYFLVPLAPGVILVAHGWCSVVAWLMRRARGRRASALSGA